MTRTTKPPLTARQRNLVEQCRDLAFSIVNRYYRSRRRETEVRELLEDNALDALFDAARHYRPEYRSPTTGQPVRFVTYATTAIKNRCWRTLVDLKRYRNRHPKPIPLSVIDEYQRRGLTAKVEGPIEEPDYTPLYAALDNLDEIAREAVVSFYMLDQTAKAMAQRYGTSGEGARQRAIKGLRKLQEMLSA